jgi:hypothetical protein
LIDLETKPTEKQSQKKNFERLLKDCLLASISIGKPRIHSDKRSAAVIQKSKPFRLTCSDIKSEHFEKLEKSFPILSFSFSESFTVCNDIGVLPYIKSHRQRVRKENRKTCFPPFH